MVKPVAKRLGKFDKNYIENKLKEFEFKSYISISEEAHRKINALSALKKLSVEDLASILLDERIMNIDVVEFVEKISNIKFKHRPSYMSNRVNIKFSSEVNRRLLIFSGVKNCSSEDLITHFLEERINEIDLIKLVKEEFN